MSKHLRFLSALGAVLFALVGLSACGGIPGDAVVQVGSTAITKTAFDHWMTVAAKSSAASSTEAVVVPEPPNYTKCIAHLAATSAKPAKGKKAPSTAELKQQCKTQYKSLQTEVLRFLISANWFIGEADSMKIKLSDQEVKKQFTKIKTAEFPKASEFEKFIASSGQTVSDLLLRVKLNLLSQKIQQKVAKEKSTVTDKEIEKYYDEHKSNYGVPEKRNVEIILTKTEAQAKAAKKEVESGKSFSSVAKRVSIDPTSKADGGLLKEVVKGEEEKALDEAIFSASKNVLGGPVKTPFGYYVYEVLSITPGSQQSLSQVRSTIKTQLTSTNQQQHLSKFVKNFEKEWKAKTDCRAEYVVTYCKQYKAPKTSKGAATSEGSTSEGSTG